MRQAQSLSTWKVELMQEDGQDSKASLGFRRHSRTKIVTTTPHTKEKSFKTADYLE